MQSRRAFAVVATTAMLAVGGTFVLAAATAGPDEGWALVGAHVHSQLLAHRSPVSQDQLRALAQRAGLQVVPFGVPLHAPQDRARADEVLGRWLDALGPTPSVPEFNTFALPHGQQGLAGLAALFDQLAPVVDAHPAVIAVAGANEPLTRDKGWASAAQAEDRVRLEYRLWHSASLAPFCHKFTNPLVDARSIDWAWLERVWNESQDAVCYDWYTGNGDTLDTLDHLREVGARLGKPVRILEAAVPGNDPATLDAMASRVDSLCTFELAARHGDGDEGFAAFAWQHGAFVERPPGAMLVAHAEERGGADTSAGAATGSAAASGPGAPTAGGSPRALR